MSNIDKCQCLLKNGQQCTRSATKSKYCWQHQNCAIDIETTSESCDGTCPIGTTDEADLVNNHGIGLMITPELYETIVINTNDIETLTAEDYLLMQSGVSDDLVYLIDVEDIKNIKIEMNLEDQAVEDILSSNPDFEQYIIN